MYNIQVALFYNESTIDNTQHTIVYNIPEAMFSTPGRFFSSVKDVAISV